MYNSNQIQSDDEHKGLNNTASAEAAKPIEQLLSTDESSDKMSSNDTKHNKHGTGSGSHRNQLPAAAVSSSENGAPYGGNPNDIEQLKQELEREKKNRNQMQHEYAELKMQMEEFSASVEEAKKNPVSKYDPLIAKQSYFNDTLTKQIAESKDKLKDISQSLKHIQACGKECNIHMRDLIIDYHCITKNELAKEIRRFQRMQIDLKSNLDRLQWRLDCESKIYHSVHDQYQKLQMDLYYLKNINEKGAMRDSWLT